MSMALHTDEEMALMRENGNSSDEPETFAPSPHVGLRGKIALVMTGLLACACVAAFSTHTQKEHMHTAALMQKFSDELTPCLNKCTSTLTSCHEGRRLFGFGDFEAMAKESEAKMKCDSENLACHGKCHLENSAKVQSLMKSAKSEAEEKGECLKKCGRAEDRSACAEKCA